MGLDISMATGRLDDAEALERFLAAMPGADRLRARLISGRREWLEQYDASAATARYLIADGVGFTCHVVAGVALEDSRRIAVRTRDLEDWSPQGFHAAVERALGVPVVAMREA
jgi:hypothetical protein